MLSLTHNFEDLWQRIRHGRGLSPTGDDPVYYLVFAPSEMLEAKRLIKQWRAKLGVNGWALETFSIAEAIEAILQEHDLREMWLANEIDQCFDAESLDQINQTLQDVLLSEDLLQSRLQEKIESLSGRDQTVLFVTDLEALHPYLRIGAIEQKLQGHFKVPTVFLYPGTREGRTTLRFLGIYPPDGNYRSVHIGG